MRRRRRKNTEGSLDERTGCVLYLRVSDQKQVENTSLGVQEQACRDRAAKLGLNVVGVFRDEARTAKHMRRPEIQRLLTFVKQHAKDIRAVITYQRDRANRLVLDYVLMHHGLEKMGVRLLVIHGADDSTPSGKLAAHVEVAFAQFENEMKSERVLDCMAAATKAGVDTPPGPAGLPEPPPRWRAPDSPPRPGAGTTRRCGLRTDG